MAMPADISTSLTMDDIPVKLRCAACNKLANNAVRMPCCDQSICGDCQASQPEACPICLHEPVNVNDCKPNKALRTTIKVFLRKKVMERETAEKKKKAAEKAAAVLATPITPLPNETLAALAGQPSQIPAAGASEVGTPAVSEVKQSSPSASQAAETPNGPPEAKELGIPTEAQKDVPQMSIESPGPAIQRRASTQTAGDGSVGQEKGDDHEKLSGQQQTTGQNEQWAANNGFGQAMNNGSFGFDATNGGFPNMGLNGMGDFSQMMQFLPNGMPNNMMNSFPNMMGMPGMGMDPMAMSTGMYGGFGGQGMGMNGMNMGMGFDAGQGAFGGFNGQPAAWNAGQNKFSQNSYGGHAGMGAVGGDFGANAGYGGYNMPPHQGNFNQMNHHQYPNNDFHHGHQGQGFQTRGRGRGRGYPNSGRGRGGYNQYNQYNQAHQGSQANNEGFNQQAEPEVTRRGSPSYGPQQEQPSREEKVENSQDAKPEDITNGLTAEEQLNKDLDPGDADDNLEDPTDPAPKDEVVTEPAEPVVPDSKTPDQPQIEPVAEKEEERPAPIQTYISDDPPKEEAPIVENDVPINSAMPPPPNPMIPTGPAAYNTADQSLDLSPRGRGNSRGYHRGFDHRGSSHGRGSGYLPNGNVNHVQSTPPVVKPFVPPAAPKGLGVEGAPKGPKALREGSQNTAVRGFQIVGQASAAAQARSNGVSGTKSPSRERTRSRSPTRHQSSHRRHHRHRSASPSSSTERERRRERHHRHSRRHEGENGDDYETKGSRARDASAGSSGKRSSHRSRREHDKDKNIERSRHRSHRSHRDKSREPDREQQHSSRKRSKSPELTINGASRMNGAAHATTSNRHKEKIDEENQQSSRKRRSDDEEQPRDRDRDRKRSRRGQEENLESTSQEKESNHNHNHRSSRPSTHPSNSNSTSTTSRPTDHDRPRPQAQAQAQAQPISPLEHEHDHDRETRKPQSPRAKSPPKGPKVDNIALEREKYAAERIARENQRRAGMQTAPQGQGAVGRVGKDASGRVSKGSGDRVGKGSGKGGPRRASYKYEDEVGVGRGESEREAGRFR